MQADNMVENSRENMAHVVVGIAVDDRWCKRRKEREEYTRKNNIAIGSTGSRNERRVGRGNEEQQAARGDELDRYRKGDALKFIDNVFDRTICVR